MAAKYETENLSQKDIDALCGWTKDTIKAEIRKALNDRPTGLESAHDVDLIFELMSRGYAVWKPPIDAG